MASSLYASFVSHNKAKILDRFICGISGIKENRGMAWGHDDHTLEEAAADMGARILGELSPGVILCELSDRLYALSERGGPWAIEVAAQSDLAE